MTCFGIATGLTLSSSALMKTNIEHAKTANQTRWNSPFNHIYAYYQSRLAHYRVSLDQKTFLLAQSNHNILA
jgi:hypothetical protein